MPHQTDRPALTVFDAALSRRSVVQGGAATICAIAVPMSPAVATADASPEVTIAQGRLRGIGRDGVRIFRGIPFAQPPLGKLRFRAPQPAGNWHGIRDATRFAPAPIQQTVIVLNGVPRPTVRDNVTSEDCLYLNVWTPATPGPHPVFFWVFGGGNELGATSDALYDCEALARAGIVCVSVGYRVGAFGFLDLSSIDPAYGGSGNNALLDMVLGLEWVRHNIAAFGGDPSHVTLGGLSAGAMNVNALLAVDAAAGLFHQAVILSGGQRIHSSDVAADVTGRFLAAAGLEPNDLGGLLALTSEAILAAQMRMIDEYSRVMPFRSVIDGTVLRRSPVEAVRSGALRGVPMLVNTNRDEGALRRNKRADDPVDSHELAYLSVAAFEQRMVRYRELFPDVPEAERRIRAVTAERYWIAALRTAEAQAAAGGTVYMSRFDFAPRSGPVAGKALHGSDLLYWFDNLGAPTIMPQTQVPGAATVATRMHHGLVGFIKRGQPLLPLGPEWSGYTLEERAVMILDQQDRLEKDPRGDERQIWSDWASPTIVGNEAPRLT